MTPSFFLFRQIEFRLIAAYYIILKNEIDILIFRLFFQTRPEGCLYLERARDNYQNYDFESRLTVRIHSALRYYTLLTQGK